MTKSKVTIGMPVYNGENYLDVALNSLLNQTYHNFELIISDNASSDKTADICKKYAQNDHRIHYIRQKNNIGALKNFEFVLKKSSCDYFMWAACDDIWDNTFIENCMNLLIDNENIKFVFPLSKISSMDRSQSHTMNYKHFSFISNSNPKIRVLQFSNLHHLSHKCNLVYSLFRTSILKTTWKYIDISNDGHFCMVILKNYQGELTTECLFEKRFSGYAIHQLVIDKINNKDSNFFINKNNFILNLNKSVNDAVLLFPEFSKNFLRIKQQYTELNTNLDYKILEDI
ncbi:glycosyltransferase family 2 protein [Arcobacter sp.]|uniref:glycosyltransferase family 2 protein n=1 Tax=Arcobacter sp. TaxID=1872629 RepID=UPI003D0F0C44